jgi:hypothetical protein
MTVFGKPQRSLARVFNVQDDTGFGLCRLGQGLNRGTLAEGLNVSRGDVVDVSFLNHICS